MTQYIGQITVILDSQSPPKASETLCFLAKQLDDTCPEVIFADHNGDIEDYATIERECEESLDPVSTLPARFDAYEIGPCQRFREDGDRDRFYYEPCRTRRRRRMDAVRPHPRPGRRSDRRF